MKILIDTNIILDIVLERQPFVEQAEKVLQICQQTNIKMFLTATTITDLYYIVRKAKDKETAFNLIKDLLQFVEIASVDKEVILKALQSSLVDFEDAIQESSAKKEKINIIVTRNEGDFRNSGLIIHTPRSFLESL